jgi:hypothetical protein
MLFTESFKSIDKAPMRGLERPRRSAFVPEAKGSTQLSDPFLSGSPLIQSALFAAKIKNIGASEILGGPDFAFCSASAQTDCVSLGVDADMNGGGGLGQPGHRVDVAGKDHEIAGARMIEDTAHVNAKSGRPRQQARVVA